MLKKTASIALGAWEAVHLHRQILWLRLRVSVARRRVQAMRRLPAKISAEIKQVCQASSQRQLSTLLSQMPISEIAEYGGSAKILQRNGYTRMSDLQGISSYRLQQLGGIGPVKSEQILQAYMQVARNAADRVILLPDIHQRAAIDYAPLLIIAKYLRLEKECTTQGQQFEQRLTQVTTLLETFGLPTKDYILNEELRAPWREHKARVRRMVDACSADTRQTLHHLRNLQVTQNEAWSSYVAHPNYFKAITQALNFTLTPD